LLGSFSFGAPPPYPGAMGQMRDLSYQQTCSELYSLYNSYKMDEPCDLRSNVSPDGYVNGNRRQAHVEVYLRHHGSIPAGYVIHHLCLNRNCVRITHLKAVTVAENSLLACRRLYPHAKAQPRRKVDPKALGVTPIRTESWPPRRTL
jgi:hypothetical protein